MSSIVDISKLRMLISVRVAPRSSKNEIMSKLPDGTLKVKLAAPPVDGRANEALIKLLSKEFRVAKSRIRIVRGMRGRNKLVEIAD